MEYALNVLIPRLLEKKRNPLLLIIEYAVDKEFEKALFYYSSMDDLKSILLKLANGEINIEQYKLSANEVAEHYTPHNLYGRLVKEKVTI